MQRTMATETLDNNFKNLQHSRFIMVMNIVTTVTHFLLGAAAFAAIYYANMLNGSSSLKSHIYLCVVGYVILMAQAVLVISPYNSWSILPYQDRQTCHWVMQILGSILAITGSLLRLIDKNLTHFKTPHGVLGIVAMFLTFLSLIGGLINISSARLNLNVTLVRVCHSFLGCFLIITSFSSLCFAFHNYYRTVAMDANTTLAISITVLALMGTIFAGSLRIVSRMFTL